MGHLSFNIYYYSTADCSSRYLPTLLELIFIMITEVIQNPSRENTHQKTQHPSYVQASTSFFFKKNNPTNTTHSPQKIVHINFCAPQEV